jgi:hypothetical protein
MFDVKAPVTVKASMVEVVTEPAAPATVLVRGRTLLVKGIEFAPLTNVAGYTIATPVAVFAAPEIVNAAAAPVLAATIGDVPSVTLPKAIGKLLVTVTAAVTLAVTFADVDAVPANDKADIAHIKMATKRIFFMILLLFMMLID